jgi:cytochrome c-type biogenesis protein CcmE
MTVSAPPDPILPPRRRPWGILVLVAVVVVVVAWLAFSSVGNALVYYRTPSEALALEPATGQVLRLGGVVKPGSITGPATDLTFTLTDGETDVEVHSTVAPTRSFREGSGAVVEGEFRADGVFEASQVIVKHDENYEAPPPGALPSDQVFEPGDDE